MHQNYSLKPLWQRVKMEIWCALKREWKRKNKAKAWRESEIEYVWWCDRCARADPHWQICAYNNVLIFISDLHFLLAIHSCLFFLPWILMFEQRSCMFKSWRISHFALFFAFSLYKIKVDTEEISYLFFALRSNNFCVRSIFWETRKKWQQRHFMKCRN